MIPVPDGAALAAPAVASAAMLSDRPEAPRAVDPLQPLRPAAPPRSPHAFGSIVEIGGNGLLSRVDPQTATLVWAGREDLSRPLPPNVREFGPRTFWQLWRACWRYEIDTLVVIPPGGDAPWHWRSLRSVFRRPFGPWRRLVRLFGVQAVRLLPRRVSTIVVDSGDQRTIARRHRFLVDRCTWYFKRELPIDRWQALEGTLMPARPDPDIRGRPHHRRRLEKLRPLAVGLLTDGPTLPPMEFPDKTVGLFVAIGSESSTVRQAGLAELRALAERRTDIVIAEERLLHDADLRGMASAWLTWSPEGLGWDCARHYEAASVYSVPVINQPTIVRFQPLVDGVHALHYDADVPGSLTRVVEAALADPERLRRIAGAARTHVAAHHLTPWQRAEQLLSYRSGLAEPPGGIAR